VCILLLLPLLLLLLLLPLHLLACLTSSAHTSIACIALHLIAYCCMFCLCLCHPKRKAEGEPAKSQESKGAKLPSGAARGAVDALELSESGEYSSDVPPSDSSDE
jgi:hypothetical protein